MFACYCKQQSPTTTFPVQLKSLSRRRASKSFSQLCLSVAAQEFKSAVLLGCFHFRKFPHWPLHPKRASLDQSEASICQRDRARPIRWQDFGVKWAEGRSGWMLASCALAACPRRPPRSSDDRQHEEIKLSPNI